MGIDLQEPKEIPKNCCWSGVNVLAVTPDFIRCGNFDFIVASSPCEEFSVHGMKHFHPNPKYPEMGIKLFNHTRSLCEDSGVPYVMENVRAAQQFVGNAVHHCGPFYLWGNAVPPLLNQGIGKGTKFWLPRERRKAEDPSYRYRQGTKERVEMTANWATIPPELANCVADYAERLREQRAEQRPLHREAAAKGEK